MLQTAINIRVRFPSTYNETYKKKIYEILGWYIKMCNLYTFVADLPIPIMAFTQVGDILIRMHSAVIFGLI